MTNAYWERVVSSSVNEIRAGRTPNPDMLCNSQVKFGAFFEYLEQLENGTLPADSHPSHEPPIKFDRVASGHYARVVRRKADGSASDASEVAHLTLTPDAIKDQTYFLAHLTQSQLSRAMFPLGALSKPQVRVILTHFARYEIHNLTADLPENANTRS
jgi:tRNA-5-taurinomethyluridine 2-sulfurtransferase